MIDDEESRKECAFVEDPLDAVFEDLLDDLFEDLFEDELERMEGISVRKR